VLSGKPGFVESMIGIKPVKVGLNVTAALEKGQVFLASVLDIDVDKVRENFAGAARTAFNLAMEVAYVTKDTASALITKGYKNAKAVALEANILNSATVGDVLAKASAEASALKAKIPDQPAEEKPAEAKEEKPAEEKPESSEEKVEEKPAKEKEEKPEEKPAKEKEEKPKEEAKEEKKEDGADKK